MANPGQQDPAAAYSQLNQGQLAQVAREFIQRFQGSSDPQAQQFAQMDPNQVTPQQVAQMHQHAAAHHPGILGDVMQHPLITGLLGGFAAYEVDKHLRGRG